MTIGEIKVSFGKVCIRLLRRVVFPLLVTVIFIVFLYLIFESPPESRKWQDISSTLSDFVSGG